MRITELVKELEKLLLDVGDVIVEVRNPAGEFDESSAVQKTHYGKPGSIKWRAFIDT